MIDEKENADRDLIKVVNLLHNPGGIVGGRACGCPEARSIAQFCRRRSNRRIDLSGRCHRLGQQ
jgi:hypothetical protein